MINTVLIGSDSGSEQSRVAEHPPEVWKQHGISSLIRTDVRSRSVNKHIHATASSHRWSVKKRTGCCDPSWRTIRRKSFCTPNTQIDRYTRPQATIRQPGTSIERLRTRGLLYDSPKIRNSIRCTRYHRDLFHSNTYIHLHTRLISFIRHTHSFLPQFISYTRTLL